MSTDPLEQSVQFVKGCGPERAALLTWLDINTVRDLLWSLPRDVLALTGSFGSTCCPGKQRKP